VSPKNKWIAGRVLLNLGGSLLVRKAKDFVGSRYERFFLEIIVSCSSSKTVPLVYPEAMMMSSIFWKGLKDGSIVGALPSCLWSRKSILKREKFASASNHMKTRLKSHWMPCSTDTRYQNLAFDVVNNEKLIGTDTRVVMRRGFEHMGGSCRKKMQCSGEVNTCDAIDARETVNKLASMIRQEQPTYFYTHTFNIAEHFGFCKLSTWIKQRRQSIEEDTSLCLRERRELIRSFLQSASVVLIRTCMEVGEIFMDYLVYSPEMPCGKITKYWWRYEFQDTKGNLPHIHCLLWTDDDNEDVIRNRIRCSLADLLRDDDIEHMLDLGIMLSEHDVYMVRRKGEEILAHNCSKAGYRCMRRTGTGDDDVKCRVPNYGKDNPYPTMYWSKKIDTNHSEEAIQLLQEMGLCWFDSELQESVFHPKLVASKEMYPASQGEHLIPCNRL